MKLTKARIVFPILMLLIVGAIGWAQSDQDKKKEKDHQTTQPPPKKQEQKPPQQQPKPVPQEPAQRPAQEQPRPAQQPQRPVEQQRPVQQEPPQRPVPQQQPMQQPQHPVQQERPVQQQPPAQQQPTYRPPSQPPSQPPPAYHPLSQQPTNPPPRPATYPPAQQRTYPASNSTPGQRPAPPGQNVPRPGQPPANAPHPGPPAAPTRTYSQAESQQHIQQLNQMRPAGMGINARPLPQGQVSTYANGRQTIATNDGRQIDLRRDGTVQRVTLPGGGAAAFRPDGHIRSYEGNGMRIEHGFHGERRIERQFPDGRRWVDYGGHRGYVERPYLTRGGQTFYSRTYVVNNVTYTRVYTTRVYYGQTYYHYVPVYYYHPAFYVWIGNPWPQPVYYRWGWYSAPPPWYAYYGPYFSPAPSYAFPSLWLTDYLIAENLRLAYEAQTAQAQARAAQAQAQAAEAQAQAAQDQANQAQQYAASQQQYSDAGGPATPLTPEIKQEIADEVRQQIDAERAQAAPAAEPAPGASENQPPPALDPQQHVFIVDSALNVPTDDGRDCSLSQGDVIKRLDDTPSPDGTVRAFVRSNKEGDCSPGTVVAVKTDDLQEMNNNLHEQIDTGMNVMASNQAQQGMPPAPDTQTTAAMAAPAPDPGAANSIQGLQQAANQTEDQVQRDALAPQPGTSMLRVQKRRR